MKNLPWVSPAFITADLGKPLLGGKGMAGITNPSYPHEGDEGIPVEHDALAAL